MQEKINVGSTMEMLPLQDSDPDPIVASFEPDPDRISFAGPPADRELTTEPQKRHDTTRTLPRGSACADRYGKTFVVWPDGSHGYDAASRVGPDYSSHSFGPYTVLRDGLTAEQCDDIAAGDRCGTDPIPEAGAA